MEDHLVTEYDRTSIVDSTPAAAPKPSAFHTIVFGGLVVGVLDGIAATVNAGIRGITPVQVFQYISSALLGRESAAAGGAATVGMGIVMHFGVAFGVATVFYLLSRIFPVLIRHAVISGIIYGVAVYFAMAYAIVPLTAVRQGPFSWTGLIISNVIHILFVGLPVALIARRYAR